MGSRIFREGSVGLLILLGLGIFGGLVLWLRGVFFGGNSYRFSIVFEDAAGLEEGASVRYRGVQVGRVSRIKAESNGAVATVEVGNPNLRMPSDALIEANQSGFLGQATIDITPLTPLPAAAKLAKPLSRKCNQELIVCHKSRLEGEIGASSYQLVRSAVRFTNLFSDPELFANIKSLTKNTSDATANIAKAAAELAILERIAQRELGSVSPTLTRVGRAADELALTSAQLNQLVAENRATLVSTLNNIELASVNLRAIASDLAPMVTQIEQRGLLDNLETLATNAAEASNNLRDLSNSLNNPDNILVLQQTLDAARVTFQNAQKITSDLDDLTGDPAFRDDVRRLMKGLSGLVSSTQHLHQQAQFAQVLAPMQASANTAALRSAAKRDRVASSFRRSVPYRAPQPAAPAPSPNAVAEAGADLSSAAPPALVASSPDSEKERSEPTAVSPAEQSEAIEAILELGLGGLPTPEHYGPPAPVTP